MGTWCPNCADGTALLLELYQRYNPLGLDMLTLACEHTGDEARDSAIVRGYKEHHGAPWEYLVAAGLSDKARASASLPFLGPAITSFPTLLFVDNQGWIHAVHTVRME